MARHPEQQASLRAELDAVAPGRSPSFAELRSLPRLTYVIQEAMRLYPPAWITDRVALEDDEINGVEVPRGTMIIPFIYGIHHAADYWEAPERFDPERFADARVAGGEAFRYLPFGGGPRLCIGNNFAMLEMQLVVAAWLRRFQFQLVTGQAISAKALVTLRPEPGVMMYLQEIREFTNS